MGNARVYGQTGSTAPRSRRLAVILGCLWCLGATSSADATLYEFTFEGELEQVTGSVPDPWSGIAPGTPFSVSYVFDSEAMDQDDSSVLGIYDVLSFSVTLEEQTQVAESAYIQIENFGLDHYSVRFEGLPNGAAGGILLGGFSVLQSDDLLLDIDLDDWVGGGLEFGASGYEVAGVFNSFSSRIVPSASTLVPFFLVTALLRTRKRKS